MTARQPPAESTVPAYNRNHHAMEPGAAHPPDVVGEQADGVALRCWFSSSTVLL
jgi:hypothetical protein